MTGHQRAALSGGKQAFLIGRHRSWELWTDSQACSPSAPDSQGTFQRAPGDLVRAPNGETEVAVTQHLPKSSLWLLILLLILATALKWLLSPHFTQGELKQDLITRSRSRKWKAAEPGFEPGVCVSKAMASGSRERGCVCEILGRVHLQDYHTVDVCSVHVCVVWGVVWI